MSADPFIAYNRPGTGEEEACAAAEQIRSGWLTTGPRTREFEQAFASAVDAPAAVAMSSCTAALEIALAAFNIGPGDEVIVPALTFASSAAVVVHRGATPVLVDVREEDFTIDPRAVREAVTPRTRVVMPVHYAGQPCLMDELTSIAAEHGLRLIEDAAHAVWAQDGGRIVGSIGDATAFSFYATKNLATGEGGMLTLTDASLADRARRLSLHGMSRDAWARYTAEGSYRYDIVELGYKANMTDIEAAVGLVQLRRLPEMQARREEIARRYNQAFAGEPLLCPPRVREGVRHAWHLYPLLLSRGIDRDAVLAGLKGRGVGTSVHFIPIHFHTYFRERFGWRPGQFPVAEDLFARELSLPLYPGLADHEVERVIEATLAAAKAAT